MIEYLRTPDDRFKDLPGYDFAPRYLDQGNGLKMHYLDEGAADGGVFLCLHGQPSWSYLYRKMIPIFAEHGRVVAPDLFGFGRSDKPVHEATFSFEFHRNSLLDFIIALDLNNITLVCQDWGGILGLTLPMAMPERFSRLVVMNTALATGTEPLGSGFQQWRAFNRSQPDLDLTSLMLQASPILSHAEAAAYAAPFPDIRYKAGVRCFPDLVPDNPDALGAAISRDAAHFWSHVWDKPSFMAVGAKDPVVTPAAMDKLRVTINGCPPPFIITDGGHFVQEWGNEIANQALKWFARY